MKIYQIHFKNYEGSNYGSSGGTYVERKRENITDKVKADRESGLLVPEHDILKYKDYGGGYTKIIFIGEMADAYFSPIISEPEHVEGKIRSRKTGDIIGQQS